MNKLLPLLAIMALFLGLFPWRTPRAPLPPSLRWPSPPTPARTTPTPGATPSRINMITDGRIPRSMQKTPVRPALAGAVVLIAVLAAVLFTTPSARAQSDSREVFVGLAQVGVGVTAHIRDDDGSIDKKAWQWQRSATKAGSYSDIPATEGGTSNPYTPSESDLGMWLKAKLTYDDPTNTGLTAQVTTPQPVLSQPVLSNAGFGHYNFLSYLYKPPATHRYAQGFTTGSDTRGYRLAGVRLPLVLYYSGETADGTWAVHADDAGKPAAEPISAALPILEADLDHGDVGSFTFEEFTHPDGVHLEPSTKYWIVISQTTPNDDGAIAIGAMGEWDGTLTPVEGLDTPPVDAGSEAGWSLDFEALTYYWNRPGSIDDTAPDPALLPWQTFADGLLLGGRFVLRISLLVAPEVTVQFTQDSYTVAEGGMRTVTVELSADPERQMVIPITTTGDGGATSVDYSTPSSVTFNAGETSKTFSFTATQDTVDDDDESVKLGFGTMPDAWVSAGTRDETTVSITDDDDPFVTVMYGQSSYTVAEGGIQEVTVTLSADPERTITIPIENADQGGASSADYSGVPSSITFNAGETETSFTFTATQDTEDDDEDNVKLGFGTMPDARVSAGAIDEATVSITDDDDPFVTVMYGQSSYTVAEGGMQTVTVTLSEDPERDLVIPITTTGEGGVTPADYSPLPSSVTFIAGDTEETFTFTATQDTVDDDDESVKLGFGTMPDERVSAGIHAEATVAITDDDDPFVTVMFGQDSQGVGEGETVNVTIRLSADPERTVTISITSTGQSGAGSGDYSVPASVTFNEGDTEKTIAFMATEDEEDDDDESVKLSFGSSLPGRVSEGTRTETTLNIGDDDDPTVTVTFGQTTHTVDEGATQQVTVTVSADPERTIIIPVTATPQGTATTADYEGVLPSVTFNAGGDTSKTFDFEATQDLIDDDGESVKLGFGTMPDPRVSAPAMNELTVNINDDDTADIVLSSTSLTMTEGDASGASYTVSLATEPTVDVTVTISGHAGTDQTLAGNKLSNDVLTFTPDNWNRPQAVTVTAAHDDDGVNDDDTLTHTAAGAEYDNVERALEVTVNDDDPPEIVLSPLALTVEESDSANYGVRLATEPTVPVTVTITGHAGTDLTLSGPSLTNDVLTFTAADWNILQTVTVTAAHDDDIDDDHATLTHTSDGGEYDALTKAVPVTVDDNTGNLRLVDGAKTDPGNNDNPSEGRLEVFYDGEWCTICNDYWTDEAADVACRQLGVVGGSVEDWARFRNSFFPPGTSDQAIVLDDVRCTGAQSALAECRDRGWGVHNCKHAEDVGIRCIKNSEGPYITGMVISGPPGGNGQYDVGETVTVTVTWSEAVKVDIIQPTPPYIKTNPPHLHLKYGRTGAPTTEAAYTSGTGATSTVFTATVEDRGDAHYSRIDVYYESLSTEIWDETPGQDPVGSYITSVSTGKPAILGHGFYRGPESGQQVEATTITGTPAFNDPGDDGVFEAGDTVEVTFTFSRPVQVDTTEGAPSVEVLLGGTTAKQALYLRGSGATQLVFGYTLVDGDGTHSSLLVDPNTLVLNGGSIRDAANNLDADISHQGGGAIFVPEVESDTTAPQLQSADVDGASLTLTFDEELDNTVTPSSGLFAVNVNGASRPVMVVAVGQSNVRLYLFTPVEAGDAVTVDYTTPTDESASRVQDLSGNAAESFSGRAVTNDTTPPQVPLIPNDLRVARSESGKLMASWTAPDSGPAPTGYTVQWKESGDDWANQNDVSEADVTGTSHIVAGLTDGTQYAVRVIATTDDAESAPSGEVAATPAETTPPELSSASVDGATLTLTFDEPLDTGETPDRTAFGVAVAGNGRGVDTVAVSGSAVTLTLATAVSAGETVTVDYTIPTDAEAARLKDLAGNAANSFSGRSVANATSERANTPATGAPIITGTAQVGETLTASTSGISDDDGIANATFSYQWLADDADISGATGSSYTLADADEGKAVKVRVSFTDDAGNAETLTSAATALVAERPNNPATGAPTISGTAQVGETLTASTTGVADEDGLDNVTFSYQWIANDGSADADISGATDSTYTLTFAEVDKTIKVRMSFTDDAGNRETLTSAATGAVMPRPPLTAGFESAPSSHDGQNAFTFRLRFSEEFPLSYKTLRDHAFSVTGGQVTKAQRLAQGSNIGWKIHVTPDGDGAITIVLPVTTDCTREGAICTQDHRPLSSRLEVTVSGPGG